MRLTLILCLAFSITICMGFQVAHAYTILSKDTCGLTDCCSIITIKDYTTPELNKLKTSSISDMRTQKGKINFDSITIMDSSTVKICGKIAPASNNYWGISDMWNSTWWNSSYQKMRPIVLTNVNGVPTNYWTTLSFTVSNMTNMYANASDIVFTDSDNSTILPHCINTINSGVYFDVFLNVSNITNRTVYMYYNNSNATSIENCGRAVYIAHNYLHNYTWTETAPADNKFTFDSKNNIFSDVGTAASFIYISFANRSAGPESLILSVVFSKSAAAAENDVTFANTTGGVNVVSASGYEINTDGSAYYDIYRLTGGGRASNFLHTSWTTDTANHTRQDIFMVNGSWSSYLDGTFKLSAADTTWLPNNTAAGWKYLLLTNAGSGTVTFTNITLRRTLPNAVEPTITVGGQINYPTNETTTTTTTTNVSTGTFTLDVTKLLKNFCISNTTLKSNGTLNNATVEFIANCQYGCDFKINECKPNPTYNFLIVIGILLALLVIATFIKRNWL